MIVELKRTKIGELLSDGRVESGHGIFLLRHRFQLRRVAAAEIARARGERKTRQCDNEEPTSIEFALRRWQIASTCRCRRGSARRVRAAHRAAATGAD